jgi:RNA polymerase sigma-70 factor, ECF subfamily
MTHTGKHCSESVEENGQIGQEFLDLPQPRHRDEVHSPDPIREQIEAEVVQLFRQNTGALSRYAATITRDFTAIQDGIQESFLRYFSTRIAGQQVENPRAWLFRVLRNYLLDCDRKSNSRRAVDLEEAGQLMDSRQDLECGLEQDEIFRHALDSLSPRERECVQLRLEGFGYNEIARILHISAGTVGALLTRGLKKFRETGLFSRSQQCLGRSTDE